MNIFKVLVACLIIFVPFNASAKTDSFAVSIASDHIDVTVGFNGSSIELFGDRRDKNAVVAIVVEGPKKNVTIWQKARVMGTWVNRHYAKFKRMPTYYNYAISEENIDKSLLKAMMENAIGHDALFDRVNSSKNKKRADIKIFQDALLKKNYDLGVFFEKPVEIKFINNNFFRASFDVPPSAPTGEYKIHSFLIKNGKVIEHITDGLKVEQVGLNAFIYKSAQNYGFIYALVCIFIALFSGWLVSSLRVKP